MTLEDQWLDSMLARSLLSPLAARPVVHRLVQRGYRAHGNALSPGLAQHQRQVPSVDPPLQTRMVDPQELRCHGTRKHIAELSFDLRAHDRDVPVIGVSTLRPAQVEQPLEELGISLNDTHKP